MTILITRIMRNMYEERFYRGLSRPQDLVCYEAKVKETDLFCCTTTDVRKEIEARVIHYRYQLEEYIRQRPDFLHSLRPVAPDPLAPEIVKQMIEASAAVAVGPMACVAGAMAEFVARDIESLCPEYIIENGGDIQLRTEKERIVLIYAKDSPFSNRIGVRLKSRTEGYGICTSSSTVGPSLSLGKADAVCVVATSALFADGLATHLGNMITTADDIHTALEAGKKYPQVIGVLTIIGAAMGVWGDLDLVKV